MLAFGHIFHVAQATRADNPISNRRSMMPNRGNKDAIALLKEDHKKVKGLLAKLEKTTERSSQTREKLLAQIQQEIQVHTTIEEEIFYPAYRDAVRKKDDAKLYQEAIEEHHVADLVLREAMQSDPQSEVFSAKAKVLKELIEHHADEEEKEMFPKARKVMDAARLKELGAQMQGRKGELDEADDGWIPSPKELLSALSAKTGLDNLTGGGRGGRSRSRSAGSGSRSRSVAATGASTKSAGKRSRSKTAKSSSSNAASKSKTSRSRSGRKSGRGNR
jgi:hemerythrin-like domain-containing protein